MALTLTVDGQAVQVEPGASVLDAVLHLGVDLPHLCKDPDHPPLATCRTCLVEIRGLDGVRTACTTPAQSGQEVLTRTERARRLRGGVLQLTVDMLVSADAAQHGDLGRAAQAHGVLRGELAPPVRDTSEDTSNPFWMLDRGACILCQRCVAACQDQQQIYALSLLDRSSDASIGVFNHGAVGESNCTSCGQCLATCPTDAIRLKAAGVPGPASLTAERLVESTCPYCGVGCGLTMHVDGDHRIVRVDDVPANPSSQGMLCVKGRFGLDFVNSPDRLTHPLLRRVKGGPLEPTSWDEALSVVAKGLVRHVGRVGVLGSAKATNEDAYVLQKFARLILGTNNLDHCSRLCHAPSVAGMAEMLGSGSTTNSYADFDTAGCLMVVGSDTDTNHPVIAARLRRAVEERGARLIVVNPRCIALCDLAEIWLRPRPGSDVALFNGLAHIIVHEELLDRDFVRERTEGFAAWLEGLRAYTPSAVAEATGIPETLLQAAARAYAHPAHGGSCILWGMGITQHTQGVANVQSMVNLALVSGQIGKPGSGLAPLRGQNNVQGCGDAGVLPDTLPGYQGLGMEVRAIFAQRWGAEPPADPGLKLTQMFDAALRGDLAAIYLMGENPLLTEPNVQHARRGLEALDLLVVQTPFLNETCELADVILPATTFAEKDGTFTNSERRVQLIRQARPPVGESRPDWAITSELARRVAVQRGQDPGAFTYEHPGEIFDEMAGLVPFLRGMSHARLEHGGLQWPCPTADHPGTPILFADSFPRGRGRFVSVQQGPRAAELPDEAYPLSLNTGRVLYHWHGGDLTRRVNGLMERYPAVELSIHPEDAERCKVTNSARVRVRSRRGSTEAQVHITAAQRPGEVFLPFVSLRETTANLLTHDAYEPRVGIPEYKVCAVRVEPIDSPPS